MAALHSGPTPYAVFADFVDERGNGVRIQRSSLAEPRVWIFCEPLAGRSLAECQPHLTPAMARKVIHALQRFLVEVGQ